MADWESDQIPMVMFVILMIGMSGGLGYSVALDGIYAACEEGRQVVVNKWWLQCVEKQP